MHIPTIAIMTVAAVAAATSITLDANAAAGSMTLLNIGGEVNVYGLSADGSVAGGLARAASAGTVHSFRWTQAVGMTVLPGPAGVPLTRAWVTDVSADGSTFVGTTTGGGGGHAWTNGVYRTLAPLPGKTYGSAAAVNANGSLIVGSSLTAVNNSDVPAYWTSSGVGALAILPGADRMVNASGVSDDGSKIVGNAVKNGRYVPVVWNGVSSTPVELPVLPNTVGNTSALEISGNGEVVVGYGDTASGRQAWRLKNGIIQPLGSYLTSTPMPDWNATGSNFDGSIIVGNAQSSGFDPFIWDEIHGMRRFSDVLVGDYGVNLTGWGINTIDSISDDGLTFAGSGSFTGFNHRIGWIVTVPSPGCLGFVGLAATCAAVRRRRAE